MMLHGFVLRTVKWGEHGLIVDLFTREQGRVSVAATIGRRRSSQAYWQPLNLLAVECVKGRGRLPQVHETAFVHPYADLTLQPMKRMIAMYLSEVLGLVLRAEQTDPLLYDYVEDALLWLDAARTGWANFHIVFLLHLTRFVGIYPNPEDLESHLLAPDEVRLLRFLLSVDVGTMHHLRLSRTQRRDILQRIERYYRLHFPSLSEVRSLDILREVLD